MPAARKRKAPTASLDDNTQQQSINQHFPSHKHANTPSIKPHPADYIQVGTHKLRVGHRLLPLLDSTPLYQQHDWPALFRRLDEDGVILVRGVVSAETVRRARAAILHHIRQKGALQQQPADTADETERDGGAVSGDGRALIGRTEDGKLTAGWTIDADSGGVNGDREDESATDGWRTLGTSPALTDVYNGGDLKLFLRQLFTAAIQQRRQQYPSYRPSGTEEVVTTFPDCTWLRIRGHKDLTVEHTDYYYFKQERSIFSDYWQPTLTTAKPPTLPPPTTCTFCSSTSATSAPTLQCSLCLRTFHRSCLSPTPPAAPRGGYYCPDCANLPFPFYTCWIALGPVHRQHGRLALVPQSHRLQGYEERRGGGDGKLPREWKGERERSAVWHSSDMEAGDLLLFNVKTVHGASVNVSDEFRLSMDTRVTFAERRQQPLPASQTIQPQDTDKHRSAVAMNAKGGMDALPAVAVCMTANQRTELQRAERSLRRQSRGDQRG